MCEVPVKVKLKGLNFVCGPFAMLESFSNGCFFKSSLAKTLAIRGQKTLVTVKTFTGEKKISFRRSDSFQ